MLVALDGQSGAGKSTLARAIAAIREALVVEGDDFYAGGSAWHPFDWDTGRGLATRTIEAQPGPDVIVDGAYSARPELSDLIDLAVLVEVPATLRRARLIKREGAAAMDDWYRRWDEAEVYYFNEVRPSSWFDLVVGNDAG